jgi:hypothetical protein
MDFMNANGMTRVLHPAHSPGLAPPYFFLFENVKRQFSGCSFDHVDDLLTAVEEILDRFDKPMLFKVCEGWVTRLEQSIETEGE